MSTSAQIPRGLTRQEECRLIGLYSGAKLMRQSTRQLPESARMAQNELTESHQPLVKKLAAKHAAKHRGYVEFDDLVSAGNQGLLIALERFDPTLGCRLSTYARWWIENRMRMWIRQERWQFRIPDNAYKDALKVLRSIRDIIQTGRTASAEEVAERPGVPVLRVHRAFVWIEADSISLDMPVGENGESTLVEFLVDRWSGSPSDAVADSRCRDAIGSVLQTLSRLEANVLQLRFGIGCEREHSAEEIAREFNVRVRRIKEIEARALRRLREPNRATYLAPWLRGDV